MLKQLINILGLDGITSSSSNVLLNIYLSNAQQEFLLMTSLKEIPLSADFLIIQMAAIQYNKQGSQGASIENHGGGVSITWEKDYPDSILRGIASYRKINW